MALLDDLIAQQNTLRTLIRSGTLSITHGDKTVRYRDMADLQAALRDVESQIDTVNGTCRPRFRYHTTKKALG